MSRSRFKAPFHRRILPWVFVIIFVVLAPTMIFYTSGYRLNPNKRVVERNGTMIIDSLPSRATVYLNDQLLNERTETTLQQVAPGSYTVKLEKAGYHTWQKRLEVKPELVTYINNARLWKKSTPLLLERTSANLLSRAHEKPRYISLTSTSSTQIRFYEDLVFQQAITVPTSTYTKPLWNPSDTSIHLLMNASSGLLLTVKPLQKDTLLPQASYVWLDDDTLIGRSQTHRYSYSPKSKQLSSKPLVDVKDSIDSVTLVSSTNTTLLTTTEYPHKQFTLDRNDWSLLYVFGSLVMLENDDHYLTIDLATSAVHQAPKGQLIRSSISEEYLYLIHTPHELWYWNLSEEPRLLLRKSQPIIATDWYSDARSLFYATEQNVYALELDERNGYQETLLASMDAIQDMITVEDEIIILGTSSSTQGLWKLEIE